MSITLKATRATMSGVNAAASAVARAAHNATTAVAEAAKSLHLLNLAAYANAVEARAEKQLDKIDRSSGSLSLVRAARKEAEKRAFAEHHKTCEAATRKSRELVNAAIAADAEIASILN